MEEAESRSEWSGQDAWGYTDRQRFGNQRSGPQPKSRASWNVRLISKLTEALDALALSGRILVAVSGGADSVALLRGLVELAAERSIEPVVAHLDHGLRAESADDAAWVRSLAESLRLECHVERRDVAALAKARGTGIEETARDARYEFLRATAENTGCPAIALAHTADDQAETILHHIVRGTGLAGLRGMPRERPLGDGVRIVRPLLDVTRATIEAYLANLGQDYHEDPTNADSVFTRNRIRNTLLPMLESEFNPKVRTALLRLGEQAASASEAIDTLAAEHLEAALISASPTEVQLDSTRLRTASDHVLRAAFVTLWRHHHWPRQRMGFADWQRLVDIVRTGGAVDLPGGVTARMVRGGTVAITGPDSAGFVDFRLGRG